MEKNQKKNRNRFRDALGDYYKTNRQVSKEYPAKRGGSWTATEKAMLVTAIALIAIIIIKYTVFS